MYIGLKKTCVYNPITKFLKRLITDQNEHDV